MHWQNHWRCFFRIFSAMVRTHALRRGRDLQRRARCHWPKPGKMDQSEPTDFSFMMDHMTPKDTGCWFTWPWWLHMASYYFNQSLESSINEDIQKYWARNKPRERAWDIDKCWMFSCGIVFFLESRSASIMTRIPMDKLVSFLGTIQVHISFTWGVRGTKKNHVRMKPTH